MGWFKKALKTAGKGAKLPGKALTTVAKPINKAGKKLKKVPVVGKGVSAYYNVTTAGPINFAARVARSPKTTHKAAYGLLKTHVKSTKDMAPYAAATASLVPGLGTGIAAGIGAAYALSKGRNFTDSMKEGAKAAIPGGALTQAGFNVAHDIAQGKKPSDIQLDTLSRKGGIDASNFQANLKATVNGDMSAAAKVDADLKKLSKKEKNAGKAIQVGTGIGLGKKIQRLHVKGATEATKNKLFERQGKKIAENNPILKEGLKRDFWHHGTASFLIRGYATGIGAMSMKQTEASLSTIRKVLTTSEKVGFDAGVAAYIGNTSVESVEGTAAQNLGYYIAEGLKGNENQAHKVAVLKAIAYNPEAASGVNVVVNKSWWEKFVEWLGI